MPPGIQRAMDNEAKRKVRNLWADEVALRDDFIDNREQPLYFTLPGADALDVDVLVERGIVQLTETGALRRAGEIVGVESDPRAMAAVKDRYPGMRIYPVNLFTFMGKQDLIRGPMNVKEVDAPFINLDFNSALTVAPEGADWSFPIIGIIDKFVLIKEHFRRRKFELFLTINATINWEVSVRHACLSMLKDNLQHETFRQHFGAVVGAEALAIVSGIDAEAEEDTVGAALRSIGEQKLLQAYVPKVIAYRVHARGWRVRVKQNLRYRSANEAPMVTFVILFERARNYQARALQIYQDSVGALLSACGAIDEHGSITPDI